MSDETDATGERRRRWRLGSVAARFLWPPPSTPNSDRKSAVKSAIWPADDTFPATPLAMRTYWLTLGHPNAATGHPERADRRRCVITRTYNVDPATISRLAAASPFEHGAVVAQ